MGFGSFFGFNRKNVVKVGGVTVSFPISGKELAKLTDSLTKQLQKRLPTEQDVYWFLIEFFDRAQSFNEGSLKILKGLPISLFEIEYLNMRSENSYVGKRNPGIVYFEKEIDLPIQNKFPGSDDIIQQNIKTLVYMNFCFKNKNILNLLRIKYATHYYNNCIDHGSFSSAETWVEVLESLE